MTMQTEQFKPADLAEMNLWYAARGLPAVGLQHLPRTGFIVHGIGAGFLYRTDSTLSFIDGLISNPTAPSHERAAALLAVGGALLKAGKGHQLLVHTAHEGIARWALENGFTVRGEHVQLYGRDF